MNTPDLVTDKLNMALSAIPIQYYNNKMMSRQPIGLCRRLRNVEKVVILLQLKLLDL